MRSALKHKEKYPKSTFHIVSIRNNGKFVTYHVYFWDGENDLPILQPAGKFRLGKREALAICNLFNYHWS